MTIAGWDQEDIVAFGALTMMIYKAVSAQGGKVEQFRGDDGIYEDWIDVTLFDRTIRLLAVPGSQMVAADRDDLVQLLKELGGSP